MNIPGNHTKLIERLVEVLGLTLKEALEVYEYAVYLLWKRQKK